MDPDDALTSLGDPWTSPWQLLMYNLIIIPLGMLTCWQIMAIVFVGGEPTHRCRLPVSMMLNESTPYQYTNGERMFDKCNVYENYSSATNRTMPCRLGWVYESESVTITEQWDLVCDKNYWTETSQTALILGGLVGGLVMMAGGDRFGRKVTFLVTSLAGCVITFATAFVDNYFAFSALRFLLGIVFESSAISGYVLACELFPANHRTTAGILGWAYWPPGMVVLAGMAYVTRNWSHLLVVTSVPGLLLVPLFWILPESIPWLIAKDKVVEASHVLLKAAEHNNVELPKQYRPCSLEVSNSTKYTKTKDSDKAKVENGQTITTQTTELHLQEYTLMDIVRSPTLCLHSFIMFFLWFVCCLVYYGLSLSTGTLAGNKYVNFCLSGAAEVPAIFISLLVFERIGRRWPTHVFFVAAGLSLLVTAVIPQSAGSLVSMISVAFNMFGKFSISVAFTGIGLFTPELYPTSIRNVGLGIGAIGGRLGNMVAPYSTYFARLAPWSPGVVFGTLSVLAGVATLLLPETNGRPLPQTVEQIERMVGKTKKSAIPIVTNEK